MTSLILKNIFSGPKGPSTFTVCSLLEASRLITSGCAVQSKSRKSHTTVDAEEVAKHSQLLDKWWDPYGPMAALHAMNEIRIPFIRDGMVQQLPNERTSTPLKGKKLLDVGCGGGILSEPLAALGAEVTGIDASKELIDLAVRHSNVNKKLANNKPTYYDTSVEHSDDQQWPCEESIFPLHFHDVRSWAAIVETMEHSPKYENHYDGVVASEVIEHVTNKEMFVGSCVRALKPGGHIFFTTPNRTRLTQFAGIFLAEYVFNIVPRGTHDYGKMTTPNELSFLLEKNNCHVESIYGCFYSVIQNKWYFIRNQTFLFALQAVKSK